MLFTAAHQEKMEAVTARTGVPHAASNSQCAAESEYLILAVKPQYFDQVFAEIRESLRPGQIVISLAPGLTIAGLRERLGGNVRVVRAMPNTPALLGEGMTGAAWEEGALQPGEEEEIRAIFTVWFGWKSGSWTQWAASAAVRPPLYICLLRRWRTAA